jgi:hypothetical protein
MASNNGGDFSVEIQNSAAFNIEIESPGVIVIEAVVAQGLPGRDGNAASTYEHPQTVASNLWIINHNLGRKPAVHVYNNAGTEIDAEVQHFSLNQARILFAMPFLGVAILS